MPKGAEEAKRSLPERLAHIVEHVLHQMKEGKLEKAEPKKYANYLGEVKGKLPPEGAPKEARPTRPLSQFELAVLERFEEAKEIEKPIQDNQPHFLAKTVEEWRAFFQKFVARMIGKSVELDNVRELTYRGVVKKGETKGIVVSDLLLATGKMEKFARFSVLMEKVGEFLAKLIPGEILLKQVVQDGIAGNKLRYLAIGPPATEPEAAAFKPREGIFTGAATEERIAEELGIARDKGSPQMAQAEARVGKRGKRRASGFAKLLWGEEEEFEEGGQFVPWWSWGRLTRPGGFTLKRAFYTGLFIALILVILFLINQYLGGK